MKIKNIVTTLVVAFMISSCSSPLIVPLDDLGYALGGGEGASTGWAFKKDFPNNDYPNNYECHSGSDCLRVDYNYSKNHGLNWSLIAWYPFDCDSRLVEKTSCITDLLKLGNFKEVQRFTFWARGANGNEVIEFGVGDKNEVVEGPFGFKYLKPQRQPAGRVILTTDWKKYELELANRDLTQVVPLFYAFYTLEDNPPPARFYLDDMQFEGYQ